MSDKQSQAKTPLSPIASSVAEAAQRLSMGKATLYKLINAGQIRPFRVGDRMLIAESELQRFVDERMSAGVPA